MSQNKLLEYFGFEKYFGTITGDRLFKMFRSSVSTRLRDSFENKQFIDWEIFITVMAILKTGSVEEKSSLFFTLLDSNKNNELEKEDFVSFLLEFFKTLTSDTVVKDRRTEELSRYASLTSLRGKCNSSEINQIVLNIVAEIFDKFTTRDKTRIYPNDFQNFIKSNYLTAS